MSMAAHLWESTLCAGVAALLAIALRNAPARVRHRIWLCASLKFLVPLWPLVALGTYLGAWISPAMTPAGSIAVRWLDDSMPAWTSTAVAIWTAPDFLPMNQIPAPALLVLWAAGMVALTAWRWTEWRALSRLARAATPLEQGREVGALARVGPIRAGHRRASLLLSQASFEPAVLGVMRPALLWPAGLSGRLTDAHLDAVLAHELCHVRRRDNLSALAQVVVEILFWFHPVVWWVGARLVTERERACDEEVLQMGTNERRYAEALLKVCDFSIRAPAAFVAGVGGSDLSRRIARILSRRTPPPLALRIRILLGSVLLFTAGAPLGMGVLNAQRPAAIGAVPASVRPQAGAPERTQEPREVHRPGDGVTWPKLLHEVKPSYTPEAMQARIQGVVLLEAVVLEDGTVEEVTIVQALDEDYGLDEQSVRALEQWRFEPATKDGRPVAVLVPVEMSFTLK